MTSRVPTIEWTRKRMLGQFSRKMPQEADIEKTWSSGLKIKMQTLLYVAQEQPIRTSYIILYL